jgi:hypothetical protein
MAAKGCCFFDVDDTLTDARRSVAGGRTRSEPVQACLEAGYLVGVATASGRSWQSVCTPEGRATGREAWATDDLCGAMAAVDFKTFNSTGAGGGGRSQVGGVDLERLPQEARREFARLKGQHGKQKAWTMEHSRRTGFPEVHPSKVVLFDNEPQWVAEARSAGVPAFCVSPAGRGACNESTPGVPFSRFDAQGVKDTLGQL